MQLASLIIAILAIILSIASAILGYKNMKGMK